MLLCSTPVLIRGVEDCARVRTTGVYQEEATETYFHYLIQAAAHVWHLCVGTGVLSSWTWCYLFIYFYLILSASDCMLSQRRTRHIFSRAVCTRATTASGCSNDWSDASKQLQLSNCPRNRDL
jgi:hypothetical protein